MKLHLLGILSIALTTACASHHPTATTPARSLGDPTLPAGDPAAYFTDPRLYELLAHTPLDSAALSQLNGYEFEVGSVFIDRIGEVAEDSSASVAARVNALGIIAQRRAIRQLVPVAVALHARDPRVRAAALGTADALRNSGFGDATALIRIALNDSAPEIQLKALQFIGDDDVELLRRMTATPGRSPVVVDVVRNLIRVAEERGAPLEDPDSNGILERTSTTGHSLRFVPTTRWPQWDAAAGHVTVHTAKGVTVEVPGLIEVVQNVVPVFFSMDGRYMVYEADRHIHVHDFLTGTQHDIGAGIAPRVRPITDEFVFLREDTTGRNVVRNRTSVRYDVFTQSFAAAAGEDPPEPAKLGVMDARLRFDLHGMYSPVRWMRVHEYGGQFTLAAGDALDSFRLPDPFSSGSLN
jgi:hypothetical protein